MGPDSALLRNGSCASGGLPGPRDHQHIVTLKMSKYREPFANSNAYHEERNKEPEQILWISVLTLAMNDAFRSNDWNAAIVWLERSCIVAGT